MLGNPSQRTQRIGDFRLYRRFERIRADPLTRPQEELANFGQLIKGAICPLREVYLLLGANQSFQEAL
jgi:hypothetical protein